MAVAASKKQLPTLGLREQREEVGMVKISTLRGAAWQSWNSNLRGEGAAPASAGVSELGDGGVLRSWDSDLGREGQVMSWLCKY